MKKVVLFLSLLGMCNLSFVQKKVEVVNPDEISVIGKGFYYGYIEKFTKEDIKKYNLNNTIGFVLEYIYENKVIHRDLIKKRISSYNEVEQFVRFDIEPCFALADISNDVAFSLMKTNEWEMRYWVKGESICAKGYGLGDEVNVNQFIQKIRENKFKLNDLADGKIKTKLYRLEEE